MKRIVQVKSLLLTSFLLISVGLSYGQSSDYEMIEMDPWLVLTGCTAQQKVKLNNCDLSEVRLRSNIVHPSLKKLTFSYKVSAGKILADGSTAVWNIAGLSTGVYTITVVATAPNKFRRSATKTLTIQKAPEAKIADITLSQTELVSPCRPGTVPREGTIVSETMVIDVVTKALDSDNDPVTYQYTVSGGKIIGAGATVKWDLTDVLPGTYDITAGVDDGCGICGKNATKSVTVSACTPTCSLCPCPTFDVTAPFEISSISPSVFSVNLTAGSFDPTYNWKVENGEIIDGQGTPVITVKMPLNGTEISTVRLNIGGAPKGCICNLEQTKTYQNGRLKP